jgi:hypothetical protein
MDTKVMITQTQERNKRSGTPGRARTVILNTSDLGYATSPRKVEAFRRAVEIKDFCTRQNGNSHAARIQCFTWTTPTRRGSETEDVRIDNKLGTIVYTVTENRH